MRFLNNNHKVQDKHGTDGNGLTQIPCCGWSACHALTHFEIRPNNLISSCRFYGSPLYTAKCQVRRLKRSAPVVWGSHCLSAFSKKGTPFGSKGCHLAGSKWWSLWVELWGELPIDQHWLLSWTGANVQRADHSCLHRVPLSLARYWFSLWDVSFLTVLIFRPHICICLCREGQVEVPCLCLMTYLVPLLTPSLAKLSSL